MRAKRISVKRTPKKKLEVELVTECDGCGKPLGRTCVRTNGSAACARGAGLRTKYFFGGRIEFYCPVRCELTPEHHECP